MLSEPRWDDARCRKLIGGQPMPERRYSWKNRRGQWPPRHATPPAEVRGVQCPGEVASYAARLLSERFDQVTSVSSRSTSVLEQVDKRFGRLSIRKQVDSPVMFTGALVVLRLHRHHCRHPGSSSRTQPSGPFGCRQSVQPPNPLVGEPCAGLSSAAGLVSLVTPSRRHPTSASSRPAALDKPRRRLHPVRPRRAVIDAAAPPADAAAHARRP